jgi:hypothetical protein
MILALAVLAGAALRAAAVVLNIDVTQMDPLYTAIALVLALVALDWLLGITKALRQHIFQWKQLPDQLAQIVLPYVTPLLAAAMLSPTDWHTAETAAAGTVAIKLLVEIRDKVQALLAPAPAPPPAPA